MIYILAIVVFFIIAFDIYCYKKAPYIIGIYDSIGAFGKYKAYLFGDMILAGVVFVCIAYQSVVLLLIGIICFIIAMLIYKTAKSKCPDGDLKDNLLKNLLIAGSGVSFGWALSFFSATAKIMKPTRMIDEKGNEIFAFITGDVFNSRGEHVGKMTESNKYERWKKDEPIKHTI